MTGSALGVYIRLVVAVGGTLVFHSLVTLADAPRLLEWFVFAALAIAIGSFVINVASVEASISVADTIFIASALLFGPGPATIALAADSLIFSCRKRHDVKRAAFNMVAPAVSMWVAAQTFFLLSGAAPLASDDAAVPVSELLLPLACLTVIYFALNSGLMAIAVGLDSKQSPLAIWRRHFLWLSLGYVAAASLALCLILVIRQVGLGAVAVVLPVLAIFHLTLRASFGRLEDAHRHLGQMDRLYRSTVETLAMAIDAKDDVTHSHVRRVQAYAGALARALGVGDGLTLKAIDAAALLHDTGKLGVPEHILNKPGGLTPGEFEQMKKHVDIGADILSLVEFPYPVVPIVRCHHENWDGTGYPRGVAGEEIPIGARILSVVDCFDALTSDRPYRKRLSDEAALDILRERSGKMYDPNVVATFIGIYKEVKVESDDPEQRQVMQQIVRSRNAVEPVAATAAAPSSPPAPASDDLLAFVSLGRLASGAGTLTDVLALASGLIRAIVPTASGAWFVPSESGDRLVVVAAFGPGEAALRRLNIRVGDRLTGWVAANRQVIVNSDAALDLGTSAHGFRSCMSVPLTNGAALTGVLSLYAADSNAFTEDQGRVIQMVAPHTAQALDAAVKSAAPQFHARDLKLVKG
jgi:putative nucleotidyltransferase with HDIG domain